MKRILALLSAVVLTLCLFAGCGGSDKKTDTGSNNGANNTGVSKEDVVYTDSNGEFKYAIVYPERAGVTYGSATSLTKKINTALGVKAKAILQSDDDGVDKYEILLGNTDRPESEAARKYLLTKTGGRYNDYVICTIGKKIAIYGMTDDAFTNGVNYFVENFLKSTTIKGGIEYCYATEGSFETITINGHDLSGYSIVRPHYNSGYLAQVEMEALSSELLEKTGYLLSINHDTKIEKTDREIIIGASERDGVESITDYDTYSIKISGDKVYLNGGSPYATAMAVSEFKKMLLAGAVTDASSTTGSYRTAMASYDAATTYRLVWTDDFDGTWVDETKWDVINAVNEGQNGKNSCRSENNISFENGKIVYTLTQDDANYYGATLRTNNKFKYQYGYIETSVQLPNGSGFWSALWTDGTINHIYGNPEIDIIESFGNGNVTNANAHTWAKNKAKEEFGWTKRSFDNLQNGRRSYYLEEESGERLCEGMHTYGFLWTPDELVFTGDGEVYCRLDMNDPQYADYKYIYTLMPQKMTLTSIAGNVGCPFKMTATDEDWANTNKFYCDYVHVYQLQDGQSTLYADAPVEW